MTATKPTRRPRPARSAVLDRMPIRVNIVRLVPGKTRLPVGADPDLEFAFAA